MTRGLLVAVLFGASLDAVACPLCMGAFQSSTAQQLVEMRRAVLAVPVPAEHRYRVIEVIKGERPSGGLIDDASVHLKIAPSSGAKTLLLVSDAGWQVWVSAGSIGAEHASWLRRIAAGKRSADMSADDWRARVALALPYLENRDPLAAEIAYGELASAPYAALLTAKPRLAASDVRHWLGDARLADRHSLYLLLLGIGGNAQDAAGLEQRLDAAWQSGDATNLGSLIAADLQLRGPVRMDWVDDRYLRDRKRSTREIEAALLALSVHGNANERIPRKRVIESYRVFMKEHKDIAGFVAQDLAAWQYWDAVPDYVAIMKSDLRQQYPSRLAIVAYLRQSPGAARLDLPLTEGSSTSAAPRPGTVPVVPQ